MVFRPPREPWMATAGEIIRAERVARRLSQSDVAREIGMSRTIISEVEHGIRPASVRVLNRIAAALGVDPAVLRARYYSAVPPRLAAE